MGFRYSTGYRTFRMRDGSFQRALQNGALLIYSGTQPATADTAPSGTLLCTITQASGARTAEVLASGTVTLTGGAAGTVDSITVNSVQMLSPNQFSAAVPVSFNASLTQTAADTATQINKGTHWHGYVATSAGAIITLKPAPGLGDSVNGHVVACTSTTITNTPANMASGVDPANGIQWGTTASGEITKEGVWSGVNAATGTAGWARFVGSIADAGGASTTLIRVDMDIATAGTVMTMSSTSLAAGATTTIDSVAISQAAA